MYNQLSIFTIAIATLAAPKIANSAHLQYYSAYEYLSQTKTHYLAVGIRTKFRNVSLEISNGIKKAQRDDREANQFSNGTQLGIHVYPFHGPESPSRFVISAIHLSDLFRGKPFNDKEEPVDHFLGAGYSILRDHYEIDLLFGKESHDCSLDRDCNYSNQFKATIRYIF